MKHSAYILTRKSCRYAAIAVGLLGSWAMASADVAIRVDVKGAGKTSSTRSGAYEIDYSGDMARVVGPDGTVRLIDLRSLHVAKLDSAAKTYMVEPLFTSTTGGWRANGAVAGPALHIAADDSAGAKTIAGFAARHLTYTSTSGTSWTGDGWYADMSAWQTRPLSVSPILMTALTPDVGRDIANRYDQAQAFPLVVSVSNGESGEAAESVTLTVSSVQEIESNPSLFQIPAGYRQVKVG